jgi:hypothetical protein
LDLEKLSAQCKQAIQNPKSSPECPFDSLSKGDKEPMEKMCHNRQRCIQQEKKIVREACVADANTTEVKIILGSRMEYIMESACIKDSKGDLCILKGQKAKTEQEAKQMLCGDCYQQLVIVLKKGAEKAQEERDEMMQAAQRTLQLCSNSRNLQKRADKSNSTSLPPQHISGGPSLPPTVSLGIVAALICISASILLQF